MNKKLKTFYSTIDGIEIAMMTTRRRDGHLRSRAMATQRQAAGADLWFVCREGSAKLDDLSYDQHLNLSYYRDSNREWVSVSGTATVSRERSTIARLFAEDWKIWFPQEGDARHGTADDPRLVLIGVTVHAVEFLEVARSRPVLRFEPVKGWLTGREPEFGEMHAVRQQPGQS